MSDERRIIDTRIRPKQPEPAYDPDLIIDITLKGERYDVIYNRKTTETMVYLPVVFFDLTREEMVREHIQHILESKPKTVMITAEGERAFLHPGVVRSIVEGKLGVAELTLR